MAIHQEDRTEPATPRRRQEARSKGQVARSHDLNAAVLLLAAFLALRFAGPPLFGSLGAIIATALTAGDLMHLEDVVPLVGSIAVELAKTLGPFLMAMLLIGLIVVFAQVGPLLTWHPLIPSLSKINPLNGLKRLFSVRSAMLALVNLGKLVVVAAVAYVSCSAEAAAILFAARFEFMDLIRLGAVLVFELGTQLAAALLVLALFDLAWQRFRHERDLRMTRQEVNDELRSMEGDPHIKRRRRQLQLQLAMQRLRKEVPAADVVVTNPTHIAVAIRYDAQSMIAPKVVAKGADYVALRIRQIAAQHSIPIVERRPLARALYESAKVGHYIPERFFRAVAEILAYIYELNGSSAGLGPRAVLQAG